MTALNAILARQGQMNPQAGVMNGQQGLPMSGGVMQSKPPGILRQQAYEGTGVMMAGGAMNQSPAMTRTMSSSSPSWLAKESEGMQEAPRGTSPAISAPSAGMRSGNRTKGSRPRRLAVATFRPTEVRPPTLATAVRPVTRMTTGFRS